MQKHHVLPTTLNAEQLANWLMENAKDKFKDEQKIMFELDDLNKMAMQSSGAGSEMMDLKQVMADVKTAVENGFVGDEPKVFTIYPTNGTKALDKQRQELDKDVKKGYRLENREVYGIPDTENAEMVYFDISGNEIKERTRPLSPREKQEYIGVFLPAVEENLSNRRAFGGM